MKVKELIEILEVYDPETTVGLAYSYGDYPNTVVVAVAENVFCHPVVFSDYHRMNRLALGGDKEDGKMVVIFSDPAEGRR